MHSFQRDVTEFHRAMGLPIGDYHAPKVVDAQLRRRLIEEEIWETIEKGLKVSDWEQVIDGLLDSMYVTVGAAISFGIYLPDFVRMLPALEAWQPFDCWMDKAELLLAAKRVAAEAIAAESIHEAAVALAGLAATIGHVAGFWGIDLHLFWSEVQRANMDKVGGPVRADGKRLKPPGWRGPDHMPLIRQLWPHLATPAASAVVISET